MSRNKKILYLAVLLLVFGRLGFGQEIAEKNIVSGTKAEIDSITILKAEIQRRGDNYSLQIKLGELYISQERLDEAEELFQKLVSIDTLTVEALTGYGRVYFHREPSKIIPFERLKELLKIDFRSKAISLFKQALAIDSTYLPARYFLARAYLRKSDEENLSNAEKELKYILGINPNYCDLTYQLGLTFQKKKEYQKALNYFQSITNDMKDYPRARIRMSEVYYEVQNYEQTTLCYYQAMETLTDKETLDFLFDEQEILLIDAEKKEFETAPYPEKRNIFNRFWKCRDPDPSTVENERLTEHFRRVNFARKQFHFTAPPYYDDRGKIYIKYGEPDSRFNSPFSNIPTKDNESWSYESIARGLVFDFVADGGYYRSVIDLTEAALSGSSFEQRLYLASMLYQDRSHISDTYARLASTFSMDQLNNFRIAQSEAVKKHPGEVYSPKEAQKFSFPFITNWAQFKGDNNKTRVEFYTSFPGMALKFEQFNPSQTKHIDFFIEADDSNYAPIFKDKKRMSYNLQNPQNLQGYQFIFQCTYLFQPGHFNLAFVIEDVDGKNKGIKRNDIVVQNFSGDSLLMSNLQLAENIAAASTTSNLTFTKAGLEVNPYTFKRVMRGRPIFIYFEIYNLKIDERGLTNFEVAYSISVTHPERNFWQKTLGRLFASGAKNIISTSTKRVGDSMDSFEYIALDLKNMYNGEAEISINISDLNAHRTVEDFIQVILID